VAFDSLMWEHCHCSICLSRMHRGIFPQCLSLSSNSSPPLYYGVILPCPFYHPLPFPVLCVCPTCFPMQDILWLVFKATHLINVWSGYPWWLGSWLLPNRVCNRNGWMTAIPFMAGLIWFLNYFPLLK